MKIKSGVLPRLEKGRHYDTDTYESKFKSYDECTDEQKKLIDARREKIERFRKKVEQSKTKKYDKTGFITIPIYMSGVMDELVDDDEFGDYKRIKPTSYLIIPMTQRELAQAGLLPEDFHWKRRITTRELSMLSKNMKITRSEISEIKRQLKPKDKEIELG